jgi:hypothetical protein
MEIIWSVYNVRLVELSGPKVMEYLKDKINELETNSKNKNILDLCRGVNEFRKGYRPRCNLLKGRNVDLLAGSHCILNRSKYFFYQLLNVHGVNDVWQTEVHTDKPKLFEIKITIEKLKSVNHEVLI